MTRNEIATLSPRSGNCRNPDRRLTTADSDGTMRRTAVERDSRDDSSTVRQATTLRAPIGVRARPRSVVKGSPETVGRVGRWRVSSPSQNRRHGQRPNRYVRRRELAPRACRRTCERLTRRIGLVTCEIRASFEGVSFARKRAREDRTPMSVEHIRGRAGDATTRSACRRIASGPSRLLLIRLFQLATRCCGYASSSRGFDRSWPPRMRRSEVGARVVPRPSSV